MNTHTNSKKTKQLNKLPDIIEESEENIENIFFNCNGDAS